MKNYRRGLAMLAMVLVATAGAPTRVRRSTALEARRRSAIDRNLVRLGRSSPETSAADREAFQSPARRGNSFLRLGRSHPVTLTDEDLVTLLRAYEDGLLTEKQTDTLPLLGRDAKFIRFSRSGGEGQNDLILNLPQRKGRARDHFVRLGRDVEDTGPEFDDKYDERKKRSTEED